MIQETIAWAVVEDGQIAKIELDAERHKGLALYANRSSARAFSLEQDQVRKVSVKEIPTTDLNHEEMADELVQLASLAGRSGFVPLAGQLREMAQEVRRVS